MIATTRREGVTRQVNVQLVETDSGRQVWAQPFTYAPGASGAQSLLAARIARLLNVEVLRAETRLPLPANPDAGHYVNLGRVPLEGERSREAEAQSKAWYDKALALDPNSIPALNGYGRVRVDEVLNGRVPKDKRRAVLDEAQVAIDRAIELEPRVVGTHYLRGLMFRARGRDADAIASFQRVVELQPNFPLAHAELGRVKIEVGLAEEAVGHIETAIHLSPADPYLFAWYYWAGMAETHVATKSADSDVERYKIAIR